MNSFVRSAGTRTVSGVDVRLTETTWSTGPGSSFDVYLASDGTCLTMDESFDDEPSDDQIAALISADRDEYGYLA